VPTACVGFVFIADDSFVGVDLNDCRVPDTRTLMCDAAAIVDNLASYTEVNSSETGVHVLVEGALPRAAIVTAMPSVTRQRGSLRSPVTTSQAR